MELPRGYAAYILHSPTRDRYYVGQCSDLSTRLPKHLEGTTPSTRNTIDWQLMFFRLCSSRSEAMKLELLIKKKKSSKSIRRFILDPRNDCHAPIPIDQIESPDTDVGKVAGLITRREGSAE